jgi:hypothetical protein
MNALWRSFAVSLLVLSGLLPFWQGAANTVFGVTRAIERLRATAPKENVEWNVASARTADVTCDGKPDTVMFGRTSKLVFVGIVPGGNGKPQTLKFPLSGESQDSFCDYPTGIDLTPIDCNSDEYGRLPGCKVLKGCQQIQLDDGGCDHFNFYWDRHRKMIVWWRN